MTSIRINTVFPNALSIGSIVLLCDFHEEKAWHEWRSKLDNGVATILDPSWNIAQAETPEECSKAIQFLKNSQP